MDVLWSFQEDYLKVSKGQSKVWFEYDVDLTVDLHKVVMNQKRRRVLQVNCTNDVHDYTYLNRLQSIFCLQSILFLKL